LSEDIKDRLQRTSQLYKTFKLEDHLGKVRNLVRESEAKINSEKLTTQVTRSVAIPKVEGSIEETKSKLKKFIESKDQTSKSEHDQHQEKSNEHDSAEDELTGKGSFFDQVGN